MPNIRHRIGFGFIETVPVDGGGIETFYLITENKDDITTENNDKIQIENG